MLLIDDMIFSTIVEMRFDGGRLNRADSGNIIFFLLITFRVFLNNIYIPESHFLRMEEKVLLILINRIQEFFLCHHSIQLAFGIAKQLALHKEITIFTN